MQRSLLTLVSALAISNGAAYGAFDESVKRLECRTKTVSGTVSTYYKFFGTIVTDDENNFDYFLSAPMIQVTEVDEKHFEVKDLGFLPLGQSGTGASYIAYAPDAESDWNGSFYSINFYPSADGDGTIIVFDETASQSSICEITDYTTTVP